MAVNHGNEISNTVKGKQIVERIVEYENWALQLKYSIVFVTAEFSKYLLIDSFDKMKMLAARDKQCN